MSGDVNIARASEIRDILYNKLIKVCLVIASDNATPSQNRRSGRFAPCDRRGGIGERRFFDPVMIGKFF
jgi:hypothetical protein